MDLQALFKISHGVYLTGARDESGRLIGSCIDSAMVVEADPRRQIRRPSSRRMEKVTPTTTHTVPPAFL